MRKPVLKIAALALAFTLSMSAAFTAQARVFNFIGTPAELSAFLAEDEDGADKILLPTRIGLPVTAVPRLNKAENVYYNTYVGSKRFVCDFDIEGVTLNAVSNSKAFSARAYGNYIYIENISMLLGETAAITLTASHKDFGTVKRQITVALTDGSRQYPHVIASKADLLSIYDLGFDKNYIQTADISLEGEKEWTVIGNEGVPFIGVYDGGGHKITGMKFTTISSEIPALFGFVQGKDAKITGLHVEGKIDPFRYPVNAHGAIVGMLESGTVEDCSFTGDITLGNTRMTAGGIASEVRNYGTLRNCAYTGKITAKTDSGKTFIGGIAGVSYGNIESCTFNGEIISEGTDGPNIGGIAGISKGTISGCAAYANLSQYGAVGYLGGITGYNYSEIKDSAYEGTLIAKGKKIFAGGISGTHEGTVTGCAARTEVSFNGNDSYAGGIAGQNFGGLIEASSADAQITGRGEWSMAGGIAGENYSVIDGNNVKITDGSDAVITGCVFEGNVKINCLYGFAGGIAGRNYGFTSIAGAVSGNAKSVIENCAVLAGTIDVTALAGMIDDDALDETIDGEEESEVGRIVGENALDRTANASSSVHVVSLSGNSALTTTLVNGKAVKSSQASGINGKGLTEETMSEFLKNITPPAGEKLLRGGK